jgi:hypothetical protein
MSSDSNTRAQMAADKPGRPAFCVCVPARDEAAGLRTLLAALAEQDAGPVSVSLCLNNTTDDSARVIEDCRRAHGAKLDIELDVCWFAPGLAHAGSARRRAMAGGLRHLGGRKGGVLLTTDADCRPPPTWVSANLRAIWAGADVVGGRIVIDDVDPLPPRVTFLRGLWDDYWSAVRAIEDAVDPVAWDPAPRHGDHTGASLAITAKAYRASGGVPAIPTGEDRALVEAAVAAGARLVHPLNVWVRASPRRVGRAEGGMAAAMQSLHECADRGEIPMAPALAHWRARAEWRRMRRAGPGGQAGMAAEERRLPPMPHDTPLTSIGKIR